MPSIRNSYLLIASAALLLSATLLWYVLASAPLVDAPNGADRAPVVTGVTDESRSIVVEPSPPPEATTDDVDIIEPASASPAAMSANFPTAANASPAPKPAYTLTPEFFATISQVQRYLTAGQLEKALTEMNALYQKLDQLNPFEQATLLSFYSGALIRMQMWQEAITAFNLLLEVPDLRQDTGARTLLTLGQLHAQLGERAEGIVHFKAWLELASGIPELATLAPKVRNMITCLERTTADCIL